MLQTLINWDTSLSLAINSLHCGYLDNFMMIYTGRFIWIPLYLCLLIMMLRNFHWRVVLPCLVVAVLLVTFNDQLSSSFLRHLVGRLRPANLHNPISPLVHIVDGYRGGRYGFPSSHAANCWGAVFFVFYVFRRRALTLTFALWAFIMCWSRVYLGVHYLGDLLAGTLLGFIGASIIYYVFQRVMHRTTEAFKPSSNDAVLYMPVVAFFVELGIIAIVALFVRFKF